MLYGAMNDEKRPDTNVVVQGFSVKIRNPPKLAILRLPSNQEILDRLNQQRYLRKDLGRGKAKTEYVPNPKADLELFSKMTVFVSEPFDEDEAAFIISKLSYREVMSCDADGDNYKIVLKHPFGSDDEPGLTTHVLQIPTVKQLNTYRRTIVDTVDLPHDTREIKQRVQPAIDLYDAVAQSADGYDPMLGVTPKAVPPHHKTEVIASLVNATEELNDSFGSFGPN